MGIPMNSILLSWQYCLNRFSVSDSISELLVFMMEFQWFLMVLSVRPFSTFDISAHLFVCSLFYRYSTSSSSNVQEDFLTLGSRWLCHLSRQDFPFLPGKWSAIYVHFCAPSLLTRYISFSSCLVVQ